MKKLTTIIFFSYVPHYSGSGEEPILCNKNEIKMRTTSLSHAATTTLNKSFTAPSFISNFLSWCEKQENKRLLWVGAGLGLQGSAFAPITLMVIFLTGGSLVMLTLAAVALMMVLVTNLAAMPTKVTVPTLFLSILIDLGVIIACLAMGLDH